jgi:hypothetical protein
MQTMAWSFMVASVIMAGWIVVSAAPDVSTPLRLGLAVMPLLISLLLLVLAYTQSE